MIAAIPEWTFENRGPFVVLAPPQGKGRGRIHYSERHRPIRRVRDLVSGFERDPRFRIVRVGAPERMITNEGEYAALVTVDGTLLEKPVQRTVGYVFGDDFYDEIDGLALEPEEFDRFARHVRQLVLTNDLVLGN